MFRYVYVFYWTATISKAQKRDINQKCLLYLFGTSSFTTFFGVKFGGFSKRYMRCMGRAEQYLFNIPFFLDEKVGGHFTVLPVTHPFRLSLYFFYCIYLAVVPYAYIQIYKFRRKNTQPGISEREKMFRKKRNIVSFRYNIAIYFIECFATIMVHALYY